ncbi:NAC domain containing protein [Melia azedarach]|uniref:NAC domain containing protein n=1 Tax=Melia azedarach TaxID=155640 RepID=A0ACC1XHV2_MELAZ|nr:NAC domain containing protein [Melia azedarach]
MEGSKINVLIPENTMKDYNRASSDEEEEEETTDNYSRSSDEEKMNKELEQQKAKAKSEVEIVLRSFNARLEERRINGIMLPLGYRFWPSDDELIKPYLYSKILGKAVPPHPIIDINLSDYDPDKLPFDENCKPNEAYFFTCLEYKRVKGSVLRVVAKNGYWETRGGDVPVFSDKERKMMVGFKKNWTFLFGEAPAGKRSIWSMSELRLNPRLIPTNQIQIGDNLKFKMVNCAVCKIKKQLL